MITNRQTAVRLALESGRNVIPVYSGGLAIGWQLSDEQEFACVVRHKGRKTKTVDAVSCWGKTRQYMEFGRFYDNVPVNRFTDRRMALHYAKKRNMAILPIYSGGLAIAWRLVEKQVVEPVLQVVQTAKRKTISTIPHDAETGELWHSWKPAKVSVKQQQNKERQRAERERRADRRLTQRKRIIAAVYREQWQTVADQRIAFHTLFSKMGTSFCWASKDGEFVQVDPAIIVRSRWRKLTGQSPSRDDVDEVVNTAVMLCLERPLIVETGLSAEAGIVVDDDGDEHKEKIVELKVVRRREFNRTLMGCIRSAVAMVRLGLPHNVSVPEYAQIRGEHTALLEAIETIGKPTLCKLAAILRDGERKRRQRELAKLGVEFNYQNGRFAVIDDVKFAAWESERDAASDTIEILTNGKARPKRLASRTTLDERVKRGILAAY